MKDLVSKATFGFLMAQLFPGAVLVLSLAFVLALIRGTPPNSLWQAFAAILDGWSSATAAAKLLLLGCCIGAGMAIHGVHWSVVGHVEHRERMLADSRWHRRRLAIQVLLAPVQIVVEVVALFRHVKDLSHARVEENAPYVNKDAFATFEFLEEFYLYSAQFFVHTAYALLGSFCSIVVFVLKQGTTERRLLMLLAVYLIAGLFFVLGRLQLNTLFAAELDILDPAGRPNRALHPAGAGPPPPIR
jgi:hypothetical protein